MNVSHGVHTPSGSSGLVHRQCRLQGGSDRGQLLGKRAGSRGGGQTVEALSCLTDGVAELGRPRSVAASRPAVAAKAVSRSWTSLTRPEPTDHPPVSWSTEIAGCSWGSSTRANQVTSWDADASSASQALRRRDRTRSGIATTTARTRTPSDHQAHAGTSLPSSAEPSVWPPEPAGDSVADAVGAGVGEGLGVGVLVRGLSGDLVGLLTVAEGEGSAVRESEAEGRLGVLSPQEASSPAPAVARRIPTSRDTVGLRRGRLGGPMGTCFATDQRKALPTSGGPIVGATASLTGARALSSGSIEGVPDGTRRVEACVGRRDVSAIRRAAGLVPMLGWLRSYDRDWLRGDLIAGVTVAALIVPKNLGYAGIAGIPLQNGLYAAAAGAILYAIFGTSRQISMGPSSGLAAVAASAVIAAGRHR